MWIQEYRETHGLELYELAQRVNKHSRLPALISDELIYMLERMDKCVTHPLIANAIAEVCGATAEQRDSIVAEIHRGEWTPNSTRAEPEPEEETIPANARPIVKISVTGDVIAWFYGIGDAKRREPHSDETIRNRCRRIGKSPEFTRAIPYTYRYADEWNAMTPAERMQDIKADEYANILGG